MTMLVFIGDRNKKGKSDWSGAFLPDSNAFMKLHGVPEEDRLKVNLGYSEPHRATEVLDFIKTKLNPLMVLAGEEITLAVFSHGLPNKIQLGFNKQQTSVDSLSKALRDAVGPGLKKLTVVLYCCSTGNGPGVGGDNSFADRLRDSLCRHGFTDSRVVAHVSAGHTTKNPTVRFFDGLGSPVGGVGGITVVSSKTTLWKKWVAALKTDFRFRFPFLSIAQIHEELLK